MNRRKLIAAGTVVSFIGIGGLLALSKTFWIFALERTYRVGDWPAKQLPAQHICTINDPRLVAWISSEKITPTEKDLKAGGGRRGEPDSWKSKLRFGGAPWRLIGDKIQPAYPSETELTDGTAEVSIGVKGAKVFWANGACWVP